ncbi:MerR family transcriptional regulator [Roseomonas haemaphysalidis]|uniref:MerR family transcriptional regulator n=1 Tax=Roseomonas haemaphysalidis TaxID=2768162 RepID=A0ABS3KTR4_9PROT|nr:MerR family transcriptional regulator [Roseomonas haemaphysalidis]MBO1079701.1 MerR family transcriptional regulator [Roseomonas haemaphysalidis]
MIDEMLPGEEIEPTVDAVGRPRKAPTAFRTISEVAEDLNIPQHVLRFWETKFPQLKPLKRGGGRRYYRPEDIALLRRIGDLLYTQGYTIKGVQRLLREGGLDAAEAQEAESDTANQDIAPEPPTEPGRAALLAALAELEELAAELRALAQPGI